MEDIKDLMDRLKKRIISGGAADKPELKRRLDVIYEIYAGAVGPEELIVRASRYGALKYIHHENLKKRLLGIERLVLRAGSIPKNRRREKFLLFLTGWKIVWRNSWHAGRWRSVWRGRFLNAWKKSIKNMWMK